MMTIEECRRFYAEEIRFAANVQSPALVEAFARVPREDFLGPGPWELGSPERRGMGLTGMMEMSYARVEDARQVYHNVVVALDKENEIHNGQPSALAWWIGAMDLRPGERAYHLGCGVGYYTAILAELVGPGGSIACCDRHSGFAARAKANLSRYPNVTVSEADGATYDPGECDAMLINAGVTHPLPLWLDRLREGGRLVVPLTMAVGPTLGAGIMTKIVRAGNAYSAQVVTPVAIYSCVGARDAEREPLMRTALTSAALMKMKSVRRDAHEPAESCVVHGAGVCLSSAAIA